MTSRQIRVDTGQLKALVRDAVAEALNQHREVVYDAVAEALEDPRGPRAAGLRPRSRALPGELDCAGRENL